MASKNIRQPEPSSVEIAARAKQLWQIAGSPKGRERDYRAAAEAELRQERTEVKAAAAQKR